MLSRMQTAAIWDAIRALPSDDWPRQVPHAFDLVLLNRDQLTEEIGCAPRHVSTIMGTLEKMGEIRRECRKIEGMQGRDVAVYFINRIWHGMALWTSASRGNPATHAARTPPWGRIMPDLTRVQASIDAMPCRTRNGVRVEWSGEAWTDRVAIVDYRLPSKAGNFNDPIKNFQTLK
ncbi:hypothetical protein [Gluconobacter oxydans]|uniref:hypothetical protein n=1 Tax=Gluconobacter oxydans TaxID=442 RepID=UPI0039E9A61E